MDSIEACRRNYSGMALPERCDLPLFAYGLFKPGQLGFLRIREVVRRTEDGCVVRGSLLERDGLPIFDPAGIGKVTGTLLFFSEEHVKAAYERIAEIGPDQQYRSGQEEVQFTGGQLTANVLCGKSPRRGSVELEEAPWDGRKDHLFNSALDVVQEALDDNRLFNWDLRPLFRLQMAYLLLWSAIERYASLRYHLGGKPHAKIILIADEPAFRSSLRDQVAERREVFPSGKPTEKETLDPSNPRGSLEYYYQIRSNVTHRGKAVPHDFERVLKSLTELKAIFGNVLEAAFEEAGKKP
jgi:hypothetical protein